MKCLLLVVFLAGCGHSLLSKPVLKAREVFCAKESCEAYGLVFGYSVMESKYEEHTDVCVCVMRSLGSGLQKTVTIPRQASIDSL